MTHLHHRAAEYFHDANNALHAELTCISVEFGKSSLRQLHEFWRHDGQEAVTHESHNVFSVCVCIAALLHRASNCS